MDGFSGQAGLDRSMVIPPLRPTFARYWQIIRSPYSQLRFFQYEKIPQLKLKGRVLDLGGGKNAHYTSLLKIDGQLDNINISPNYAPTYVADANQPWPVESAIYDHLISFNTLEHIERDVFALGEFLRTLKPGGSFHILVPFLYRVHASPYDFHRHTALAWELHFKAHGVPPENLVIEPLLWDSLATGFSFLEMTRLRYLRPLALLIGLLRLVGVKGERLPERLSKDWSEYAVGYYISGTKPA